MSIECMECKCYSCINMCMCTVCRNNGNDGLSKELLNMETDRCEDFEHLPVPCIKPYISQEIN